MLKVIASSLTQECLRFGLTVIQTENLMEEYETEFGKQPNSLGELLEVLE